MSKQSVQQAFGSFREANFADDEEVVDPGGEYVEGHHVINIAGGASSESNLRGHFVRQQDNKKKKNQNNDDDDDEQDQQKVAQALITIQQKQQQQQQQQHHHHQIPPQLVLEDGTEIAQKTLTQSFRFLRKKYLMDDDSSEKLRLVNLALSYFISGHFTKAGQAYEQSLEQINTKWSPILERQGITEDSTKSMKDRSYNMAKSNVATKLKPLLQQPSTLVVENEQAALTIRAIWDPVVDLENYV
jgi:hypothetical protein